MAATCVGRASAEVARPRQAELKHYDNDSNTHDYDTPPNATALELLSLQCAAVQAAVFARLSQTDKQHLASANHRCRRLVLGLTSVLRVTPGPRSKLHVLGGLLDVLKGQPSYGILHLQTSDPTCADVLNHSTALREGWVQRLVLQGLSICDNLSDADPRFALAGHTPQHSASHVKRPSSKNRLMTSSSPVVGNAAELAVSFQHLKQLVLKDVQIQGAAFLHTLASACTWLECLTFDNVCLGDPAARQSLGQLSKGVKAMHRFEIHGVDAAAFMGQPKVLQLITHLEAGSGWVSVLQQQYAAFTSLTFLHLEMVTLDRQSATAMAAACAHLQSLILHTVTTEGAAFFKQLTTECHQLRRLVLHGVQLGDHTAQHALQGLATAMPTLCLDVSSMDASAFTAYPSLLGRITALDVYADEGWGQLVQAQAGYFGSLHTMAVRKLAWEWETLVTLLNASPNLTQLTADQIKPPADGSLGEMLSMPWTAQRTLRGLNLVLGQRGRRVRFMVEPVCQLWRLPFLQQVKSLQLTQGLNLAVLWQPEQQAGQLLGTLPLRHASVPFAEVLHRAAATAAVLAGMSSLTGLGTIVGWPADEVECCELLSALASMARHLGDELDLGLQCLRSPALAHALGQHLGGSHVKRLSLSLTLSQGGVGDEQSVAWAALLTSFPVLHSVSLLQGRVMGPVHCRSLVRALAAACDEAHRRMQLVAAGMPEEWCFYESSAQLTVTHL